MKNLDDFLEDFHNDPYNFLLQGYIFYGMCRNWVKNVDSMCLDNPVDV